MITHIAADGKASRMVVISHLDTDSDSSDTDSEKDSPRPKSITIETSRGRQAVRRKLIWWTFSLLGLGLVLVGQITVSFTLKRNGIITRDLHDIVSERLSPVIPELQYGLELLESRVLDTIEMAKLMAPNFNETLYWRGINATVSKAKGMGRTLTQEKLRPGFQHAQKYGTESKYPVVMVPGFLTSGLEVWKGKSCMKNAFRERVWGGLSSAQYWLRERFCMMENMALDPITGGDPKGIKLRSSQGFAAADYFIGNDWMCEFAGWKQLPWNALDRFKIYLIGLSLIFLVPYHIVQFVQRGQLLGLVQNS
jgi:hypothetical protein